MNKKDLFKLINEEIKGFDFLSMDKISEEEKGYDLLNSKEFQTTLVNDIVNNIGEKSIFSKISSIYNKNEDNLYNWEENPSVVDIQYELEYNYNDDIYHFIVIIEGKDNNDGQINHEDFNIKIFNKSGEEIDLSWIKKNPKLNQRVIYQLIKPFLD